MPKAKAGEWSEAALTHGAGFTARTTISNVVVVSFASPAYGAPKSPGNHAKALRRVVDNCTAHRADPSQRRPE